MVLYCFGSSVSDAEFTATSFAIDTGIVRFWLGSLSNVVFAVPADKVVSIEQVGQVQTKTQVGRPVRSAA